MFALIRRSLVVSILLSAVSSQAQVQYDVVIYGGTSAAVTAAVQVAKAGKSVVVVSPDRHLGGLTSGGLGWTDSGNKNAIGGLSRQFYEEVYQHYQKPESWDWQDQDEFGTRNQERSGKDGSSSTMWVFEPHVAEQIFDRWISQFKIEVHRDEWLDRSPSGVQVSEGRIQSIRTLSGRTYIGKMFIDATYEGDLMAAAGVNYHVGREANSVYGEYWNGVQTGVLHHSHWYAKEIDPYVVPGDSSSGLLPEISPDPPGKKGDGDHRLQAYCFRMCLTNADKNRIPFPKPDDYDPKRYELLGRVFDSGWRDAFRKFDKMPNYKTDTNNHGPFSTDYIGANYDYPDASYERRKQIIAAHKQYQQGLMYYLANDRRVPEDIRTKMATWGLPKDEFQDNGGWTHQLYIREARRMIGRYVMTEHDCLDRKVTPEPVGMGSYTLDSHNVQRYIKPDGFVQNEGDIGVKTPRAYQISYGSLVPKKDECQNLLVPVCVSSSHIAFGSIRMEPVFMILGQSAATAACIAIDDSTAVQDIDYAKLRSALKSDGQVLELEKDFKTASKKLPGVTVDDSKAVLVGQWNRSRANSPFVDGGYQHDGGPDTDRTKKARFSTPLKAGRYEVRISYAKNDNRATNVPVVVLTTEGPQRLTVNQTKEPEIDGLFHSLGTFSLGTEGVVDILNAATDGHVIIDCVQFLPQ